MNSLTSTHSSSAISLFCSVLYFIDTTYGLLTKCEVKMAGYRFFFLRVY